MAAVHFVAGKCWMDALELALRCSALLIRSMTKDGQGDDTILVFLLFNNYSEDCKYTHVPTSPIFIYHIPTITKIVNTNVI